MTYGILREVSRDPFNPTSRSVSFRHCPNCDAWLIDPDFLSDFFDVPFVQSSVHPKHEGSPG